MMLIKQNLDIIFVRGILQTAYLMADTNYFNDLSSFN